MKLRISLGISLLTILAGITPLQAVQATDLFLQTLGESCYVRVGETVSIKVIYANNSSVGGGPFTSNNTFLRSRVPPCQQGRRSCGSPTPYTFYSRFNNNREPLGTVYSPLNRLTRRKAGPASTWEDDTLVTPLGRVEAGSEGVYTFFFVFTEEGQTTLRFSIDGDLTDPDTSNNTRTVDIFVMPSEKTLLYPWISNNEGQFESILIANNYGETEAEVTMIARRADGEDEMVQKTIPAKGQLRENASTLFPMLGSGSGYAVELTSQTTTLQGGWVTYNLTTQTSRSPSQGVAIDLSEKAAPNTPNQGADIMYNFLPTTESFISAPVLVNLGSDPANITLRFYNQAGDLVHEDIESIQGLLPMRPFAVVANQLLPENSGDVYMVASSDSGRVTGVSFVFNAAGEPSIGNVTGLADFLPLE